MDKLTIESLRRGRRSLARRDPDLGIWMKRVAEPELRRQPSHFVALARALLAQQISNQAAKTIIARTFAMAANSSRPKPEELMALKPSSYRTAGVSRQKEEYLRILCRAFIDKVIVPSRLGRMDDEDIIETLTELKGIGRWTAEMFLIGALQRIDVFSGGDLALRAGLARVKGLEKLTPAESISLAADYAPYRSVLSLYLWRIAHAPEPS